MSLKELLIAFSAEKDVSTRASQFKPIVVKCLSLLKSIDLTKDVKTLDVECKPLAYVFAHTASLSEEGSLELFYAFSQHILTAFITRKKGSARIGEQVIPSIQKCIIHYIQGIAQLISGKILKSTKLEKPLLKNSNNITKLFRIIHLALHPSTLQMAASGGGLTKEQFVQLVNFLLDTVFNFVCTMYTPHNNIMAHDKKLEMLSGVYFTDIHYYTLPTHTGNVTKQVAPTTPSQSMINKGGKSAKTENSSAITFLYQVIDLCVCRSHHDIDNNHNNNDNGDCNGSGGLCSYSIGRVFDLLTKVLIETKRNTTTATTTGQEGGEGDLVGQLMSHACVWVQYWNASICKSHKGIRNINHNNNEAVGESKGEESKSGSRISDTLLTEGMRLLAFTMEMQSYNSNAGNNKSSKKIDVSAYWACLHSLENCLSTRNGLSSRQTNTNGSTQSTKLNLLRICNLLSPQSTHPGKTTPTDTRSYQKKIDVTPYYSLLYGNCGSEHAMATCSDNLLLDLLSRVPSLLTTADVYSLEWGNSADNKEKQRTYSPTRSAFPGFHTYNPVGIPGQAGRAIVEYARFLERCSVYLGRESMMQNQTAVRTLGRCICDCLGNLTKRLTSLKSTSPSSSNMAYMSALSLSTVSQVYQVLQMDTLWQSSLDTVSDNVRMSILKSTGNVVSAVPTPIYTLLIRKHPFNTSNGDDGDSARRDSAGVRMRLSSPSPLKGTAQKARKSATPGSISPSPLKGTTQKARKSATPGSTCTKASTKSKKGQGTGIPSDGGNASEGDDDVVGIVPTVLHNLSKMIHCSDSAELPTLQSLSQLLTNRVSVSLSLDIGSNDNNSSDEGDQSSGRWMTAVGLVYIYCALLSTANTVIDTKSSITSDNVGNVYTLSKYVFASLQWYQHQLQQEKDSREREKDKDRDLDDNPELDAMVDRLASFSLSERRESSDLDLIKKEKWQGRSACQMVLRAVECMFTAWNDTVVHNETRVTSELHCLYSLAMMDSFQADLPTLKMHSPQDLMYNLLNLMEHKGDNPNNGHQGHTGAGLCEYTSLVHVLLKHIHCSQLKEAILLSMAVTVMGRYNTSPVVRMRLQERVKNSTRALLDVLTGEHPGQKGANPNDTLMTRGVLLQSSLLGCMETKMQYVLSKDDDDNDGAGDGGECLQRCYSDFCELLSHLSSASPQCTFTSVIENYQRSSVYGLIQTLGLGGRFKWQRELARMYHNTCKIAGSKDGNGTSGSDMSVLVSLMQCYHNTQQDFDEVYSKDDWLLSCVSYAKTITSAISRPEKSPSLQQLEAQGEEIIAVSHSRQQELAVNYYGYSSSKPNGSNATGLSCYSYRRLTTLYLNIRIYTLLLLAKCSTYMDGYFSNSTNITPVTSSQCLTYGRRALGYMLSFRQSHHTLVFLDGNSNPNPNGGATGNDQSKSVNQGDESDTTLSTSAFSLCLATAHLDTLLCIADLLECTGLLDTALTYYAEAVTLTRHLGSLDGVTSEGGNNRGWYYTVLLGAVRVWSRTGSTRVGTSLLEILTSSRNTGGSDRDEMMVAVRKIAVLLACTLPSVDVTEWEGVSLEAEMEILSLSLTGTSDRGSGIEGWESVFGYRYSYLLWDVPALFSVYGNHQRSRNSKSDADTDGIKQVGHHTMLPPSVRSALLNCAEEGQHDIIRRYAASGGCFEILRAARRTLCRQDLSLGVERQDRNLLSFLLGASSINTSVECGGAILGSDIHNHSTSDSSHVIVEGGGDGDDTLSGCVRTLRCALGGDNTALEHVRRSLYTILTNITAQASTSNTSPRSQSNATLLFLCMDTESDALIMGRMGSDRPDPVTVVLPLASELLVLLREWSECIADSKALLRTTTDINIISKWTDEEKRRWWSDRQGSDDKVKQMLGRLEAMVGPHIKQLLEHDVDDGAGDGSNTPPPPPEEDLSSLKVTDLRSRLKSAGLPAEGLKKDLVSRLTAHIRSSTAHNNNNRTGEVGHSAGTGTTILVLDEALQELPWENMPGFKAEKVMRIPSLPLFMQMGYKRYGSGAKGAAGGKVHVSRSWFAIDPENNLPSTRDTMYGFLRPYKEKYHWPGYLSTMPPAAKVLEYHASNELFIFAGHGSGDKMLDSSKLKKVGGECPAALLWGCSR